MELELKFRAWNIIVHRMQIFDFKFLENQKDKIQWHILKIMQYTGFKDMCGNEIYTGDIIEIRNSYTYYVGFENGSFVCYHAKMKDDLKGGNLRWGLLSRSFELGQNFKCKVIGNIYQNKEMVDIAPITDL